MVSKEEMKVLSRIETLLRTKGEMTITDLTNKSGFSRIAVRIALAKLDGARKVGVKKIGMAKVYSINKSQRGM